jgi:16S rRNA G1207 methylase RsmC
MPASGTLQNDKVCADVGVPDLHSQHDFECGAALSMILSAAPCLAAGGRMYVAKA